MSDPNAIKVKFTVVCTARVDNIGALGKGRNTIEFEVDVVDPGNAVSRMCKAAVDAAFKSNVALLEDVEKISDEPVH